MVSPAAMRGHEVRERLRRTAVTLIPERGWSAVSTRVLAERAGVNPSVVHYHYSSLQALLTDAVTQELRAATARMGDLLDSVTTPTEAVDALLAITATYTGDNPATLLFTETALAATRDATLRAAVAAVLDEFVARLGDWFATHGVADPHHGAAAVMAAVDGLVIHRALRLRHTEDSIAAVLYGLVAPPRSPAPPPRREDAPNPQAE
ncbi:TetR/AcrR family transcriptional regulator [Nocardia otitidiscaviarum]|uniref:TetR/AcrR family transcriptional regulator n=1 Tax=Nocardia otitidiscaviarum TaxID=1823 RepID=UPI0009DD626C|nr:TetR/AcrR family transcriptional regulator [Nocardia otitidiscaviarum]MBF6132640.1 TetR/AcrR family transcriptional regulator [Nocardia otitidiscaviarum]MBF6486059.1 TetR/AcrR family transcriptional regulator [Nocardia otitidiscaviarum]